MNEVVVSLLKEWLNPPKHFETPEDMNSYGEELMERTREAIAKAEGR